jgi:hypothetical protein
MSEIRVNKISNYNGNEFIDISSNNDIEIGRVNQKIICKGSLTPLLGGGVNNHIRRRTVIQSVNTTIPVGYVYHNSAGMNMIYLIVTDVEREIRLPKGSIQGDWITITDIGTGATNSGNASKKNITILPNSNDRIQGGTAGDTFILDIDAQSVTLMWCGDTYHWRIIDFG